MTVQTKACYWDVPRVFDQIDAIAQCFNRQRNKTEWYVKHSRVVITLLFFYPRDDAVSTEYTVYSSYWLFNERFCRMLTSDADEFYFSRQYPAFTHLVEYAESLRSDALPIPWYMLGSSGHVARPKEGVTIGIYTRRARALIYDADTSRWFSRRNGKMLFRASCLLSFKGLIFKAHSDTFSRSETK